VSAGSASGRVATSATLDARGRFRMENLTPGAYRLVATGPQGFAAPVEAEVQAGVIPSVRLVLEPGARLVVTVVDSAGRPAVQAEVVAVAGGRRAVAVTDQKGEALFESLMPGAARVSLHNSPGTPGVAVELVSGVEARASLVRP